MSIRLFELTLNAELQIKEYRKSTFRVLLSYLKKIILVCLEWEEYYGPYVLCSYNKLYNF